VTLEPAENVGGGDFLDLKTMIMAQGNRPLLAVVRITGYAPHGVPAQGQGWTGTNYPVKGDLLICSGPTAGEAEFGKEFIHGSITKTLRGVPNPKDGQPLARPERYTVGHELGVVFEVKNPTAPNAFVVANAPTAEQYAEIARVHADGQAWANAQAAQARAQAVAAPVAPAAPAQDPAYAAFLAQQAAAQAPPAPAAPPVDPAYAAWLASQQQAPTPPPTRMRKDPPTNPSCPRSSSGQHQHTVMSSRRGYSNCRYCGETRWTG
jgi:hypothetical protein